MSTARETLERRKVEKKIAILDAEIKATKAKQTLWFKFCIGLQDLEKAIGGRTFILAIAGMFNVNHIVSSYFDLVISNDKLSYVPLLLGCAAQVVFFLFWINRSSRLTQLTGPGDVGASFEKSKRQSPGRKLHSDTMVGALVLSEDKSHAEESECSLSESR